MSDHSRIIGQRIQAFREEFNLSESSMARLIGTTVEELCSIERGVRLPSSHEVVRLCHIFGQYPHVLLSPDAAQDINYRTFDDVQNQIDFTGRLGLVQNFNTIKDERLREIIQCLISHAGQSL